MIDWFFSLGPVILAGICLAGILLLAAIILLTSRRSDRTLQNPPPIPAVQQQTSQAVISQTVEPPSAEEMMPDKLTLCTNFSSQLQTEAHNLRVELIGDQLRYVVDGVSYSTLEEIPAPDLRETARRLAEKTLPSSSELPEGEEVLRQVVFGDQATIETRTQDYTISIQRQAGQTRYIVNGLTYEKLSEIPEPDLREQAVRLAAKML